MNKDYQYWQQTERWLIRGF